MLQVYKDNWLPVTNAYNYYVDYLYGGEEELSFSLSPQDEMYLCIHEESLIKEDFDKPNQYIIKKLNRFDDEVIFTATLYMDDWKTNKPYQDTQNNTQFQTKTLAQILDYIKPEGWSIINANITTIKRTIELDGVTNYDVLMELRKVFSVAFDIDTINKKITVIDPEGVVDKGLYIHNELNLLEVVEKGDTSSFINRLYAYGKDNLTFSSLNGGKEYVEDLRYKGNVVTGYWKDERYTDKESLLGATNKKLKELCRPVKSYRANIIDLAKTNPEYAFLDIRLYDLVHVFISNGVEFLEKVVKYREYKIDTERHLNMVTLSTQPQQLTSKIDKISSILGEDGQKFQGSILQQAQQEAANLINSFATKGHRFETENETYFLDKLPKESAKYVMRMNLGGIAFSHTGWAGPYISAWTIDGKFNASFITTGVLKAIRIEAAEIFGGTININNKFLVDKFGNLTATSGTFSGRLSGVSGEIANWMIENNSLSNAVRKDYHFVQADLEKIMKHILGEITLTDAERDRLDINGDGEVDSWEYITIQKMLSGEVPNYVIAKVSLNSDDPRKMVNIEIIEGLHKGYKTSVGAYAIKTDEINVRNLRNSNGNLSLGGFTGWALNSTSTNKDTTGYLRADIIQISGKKLQIDAFATDFKFDTYFYGIPNFHNDLRIMNGKKQEFYREDGNYVGKIQAMADGASGAVGIGIMADGGDNLLLGAGNEWKFIISGGGSYSHPLNVYGNLDMHGWNIVNGSDKRLKENIKDIDTKFIYDLEIKSFDYIKGNKDIIGIIANDYADKDYSKYFVTQGIDGLYSVNYQNINNALIQCVQEQNERIKRLEELVKELVEK